MSQSAALDVAPEVHRRRWAILSVLCLSLFVVVMDGTIVNVALPSLVTELGATTRELQWIVDAYLLVFTGLLLAAGSFGIATDVDGPWGWAWSPSPPPRSSPHRSTPPRP